MKLKSFSLAAGSVMSVTAIGLACIFYSGLLPPTTSIFFLTCVLAWFAFVSVITGLLLSHTKGSETRKSSLRDLQDYDSGWM